MAKDRNLPFSPAKRGPLCGRPFTGTAEDRNCTVGLNVRVTPARGGRSLTAEDRNTTYVGANGLTWADAAAAL
jgi:hypothetical protein